MQHLPCLMSFLCMLGSSGGSVHWGQTHLGMPRGAKVKMALNFIRPK